MQYNNAVEIVIVCTLCLAGGLCAAPLTLDIGGKEKVCLRARYLWFRRNINSALRRRLRRIWRRFTKSRDYGGILNVYAPLFRPPLEVARFRLNLAFSTGDAAETAIFHGWFCVFMRSLYSLPFRRKPTITLSPQFSALPELSLDCDISLSMPAALFFFRMISASIREKRKFHV
jgi:hypothetical protein